MPQVALIAQVPGRRARTCRFDPEVLRCKGADDPGCLTAPQNEALKVVYAPVRNPRTGRTIYPGLSVGRISSARSGPRL
jgi:hypothetical protein